MREDLDLFDSIVFTIFAIVVAVGVVMISCDVNTIKQSIIANEDCIVHNNEKYCKEAN